MGCINKMGNNQSDTYCSKEKSKIFAYKEQSNDESMITFAKEPSKIKCFYKGKIAMPDNLISVEKIWDTEIKNLGMTITGGKNKITGLLGNYLEWEECRNFLVSGIIELLKLENEDIEEEKEKSILIENLDNNGYVERTTKSGKLIRATIETCENLMVRILVDDGKGPSIIDSTPFKIEKCIESINEILNKNPFFRDFLGKRGTTNITDIFDSDTIIQRICAGSRLSAIDKKYSDYILMQFTHIN